MQTLCNELAGSYERYVPRMLKQLAPLELVRRVRTKLTAWEHPDIPTDGPGAANSQIRERERDSLWNYYFWKFLAIVRVLQELLVDTFPSLDHTKLFRSIIDIDRDLGHIRLFVNSPDQLLLHWVQPLSVFRYESDHEFEEELLDLYVHAARAFQPRNHTPNLNYYPSESFIADWGIAPSIFRRFQQTFDLASPGFSTLPFLVLNPSRTLGLTKSPIQFGREVPIERCDVTFEGDECVIRPRNIFPRWTVRYSRPDLQIIRRLKDSPSIRTMFRHEKVLVPQPEAPLQIPYKEHFLIVAPLGPLSEVSISWTSLARLVQAAKNCNDGISPTSPPLEAAISEASQVLSSS
jgi:hypothetical protein